MPLPSPPQGNLIGAILDTIAQSRVQQLEQGTREQLNAQQGFANNVDPFAMQKFGGETQRQTLLGEAGQRQQETQGFLRDDRTSAADYSQSIVGNPMLDGNPLAASMAGNKNPALVAQMIQSLIGTQGNAEAQQNFVAQNKLNDASYASRDAVNHKQRLEEIQQNNAGRAGGAGANMWAERKAALDHFSKTQERLPLQQWEQMYGSQVGGRDYATIQNEISQDSAFNAKHGGPMDRAAKGAADGGNDLADTLGGSADGKALASPNQQAQIDQGVIGRKFEGMAYEDAIAKAIQQDLGIGDQPHRMFNIGGTGSAELKRQAPEIYDQVSAAIQQQLQEGEQAKAVDKAKNPVGTTLADIIRFLTFGEDEAFKYKSTVE